MHDLCELGDLAGDDQHRLDLAAVGRRELGHDATLQHALAVLSLECVLGSMLESAPFPEQGRRTAIS